MAPAPGVPAEEPLGRGQRRAEESPIVGSAPHLQSAALLTPSFVPLPDTGSGMEPKWTLIFVLLLSHREGHSIVNSSHFMLLGGPPLNRQAHAPVCTHEYQTKKRAHNCCH